MLLLKSGCSGSEEEQAFDVQNSSRMRALTKSTMASPDLRNSFRIFRADMEQMVLWLIIEVSLEEKNTSFKKRLMHSTCFTDQTCGRNL